MRRRAFIAGLGAAAAWPRAALPTPGTASDKVIVLDSDTASFTNGKIGCKDNPWNKGNLARNVNYSEKIYITPATFPDGVKMEWIWPAASSIGQIYSYPMLFTAYHSGKAISGYSNISTSFDYTCEGNGDDRTNPNAIAFDVLHETWLTNPKLVEVMVMLTPREVLPRTDNKPFISVTAGAPGVEATYDVAPFIDGWQKIICYPTTHSRTSGDNRLSNPTMAGAVAGTPGRDPTGFQFNVGISRLTKSIVGSGITTAADGSTVNYVDVRLSGRPSATGNIYLQFYVDNGPYIKSRAGQNWFVSAYLAVKAAGTGLANLGSIQLGVTFLNSASGVLGSGSTVALNPNLSESLENFGYQAVPERSYAPSVANAAPFVLIGVTAGQAVNTTLRLAGPMAAWDNQRIMTQGKLDWKALFTALVEGGVLTGAEVMTSIQFGAETNGGHGSLAVKSYAVEVS